MKKAQDNAKNRPSRRPVPEHLSLKCLVSLGLSKGDPQWAKAHGMEKTPRTGRRHRVDGNPFAVGEGPPIEDVPSGTRSVGHAPFGLHHLCTMFDAGHVQAGGGFIRTVRSQVGRQQLEVSEDKFLSGVGCAVKPFGSYRRSSVTSYQTRRPLMGFWL